MKSRQALHSPQWNQSSWKVLPPGWIGSFVLAKQLHPPPLPPSTTPAASLPWYSKSQEDNNYEPPAGPLHLRRSVRGQQDTRHCSLSNNHSLPHARSGPQVLEGKGRFKRHPGLFSSAHISRISHRPWQRREQMKRGAGVWFLKKCSPGRRGRSLASFQIPPSQASTSRTERFLFKQKQEAGACAHSPSENKVAPGNQKPTCLADGAKRRIWGFRTPTRSEIQPCHDDCERENQ